MDKPKIAAVAGFLLLSGLAGIALWFDRPTTKQPPATPTGLAISGGALYSASFPDLQGRPQSLGQWPQDWLLINFWASWCAPCREEMPGLAKIQKKYATQHVKILGIAADSAANAANFAQYTNIDYTLLADENLAIAFSKRLGNDSGALPYSVLVRPGGEVVWSHSGPITEGEAIVLLDKSLLK